MSSYKDQGNEEFKKENYLKAAALYTKAIKEDPQNAVLFSNRSAALLKLNKVTKALEDAEACISLKPDWEKGYFRKGAVLEALDKLQEALDVYQAAARLGGGEGANKELAVKIRNLAKLLKFKTTHKEETLESLLLAAVAPAASAAAAANGASQPGGGRLAGFCRDMAAHALERVAESGATFPPSVHFLPGPGSAPHEEREEHVSAAAAFGSPELLGGFVSGMRAEAARLAAEAVVAVVPKAAVAYPQLWTRKGWPAAAGPKQQPGLFVQLEVRGGAGRRHAWFLPVRPDKTTETPVALNVEDFGLLPTLLG
ncbi:hypothetical protein Agub_g11317 [Astrephomene gubernaculifera]|uniref:Uncharacterized protein n=1 Tax=Astrephomene gubernaculifera TaxID=47775 RepID=A0AAD3HQV6_9CHLO|nr:hypothetical protein Agub_g11317 [Astrephomene gubernaculifera]